MKYQTLLNKLGTLSDVHSDDWENYYKNARMRGLSEDDAAIVAMYCVAQDHGKDTVLEVTDVYPETLEQDQAYERATAWEDDPVNWRQS